MSRLERIAGQDPDETPRVKKAISEIRERQGDWGHVYEATRGAVINGGSSAVKLTRLCRAQLNLHLGVMAMVTCRRLAEAVNPRPATIRTFDLGGDKFLSPFESPKEMNPYLGWRGIRFGLARTDIMKVFAPTRSWR